MIYGVGTDICDVRRIRASLARHGDRFARKILSDAEFATWQARSQRWMDWQQTALNPATRNAFVQLIRTPVSAQQPDLIRQSVDETEHLLTLLEAQLSEQAFMAGEQFSMADIPVACEIHRWFGLPRTRAPHRHIERWYQGLQQRRASQGVLDIALS